VELVQRGQDAAGPSQEKEGGPGGGGALRAEGGEHGSQAAQASVGCTLGSPWLANCDLTSCACAEIL
jgi:hypothetical protein